MEDNAKTTVSVRFNDEEMRMLEVMCKHSFTTRSSILKKAFYFLYESEKRRSDDAENFNE